MKMTTERFRAVMKACNMYAAGMRKIAHEFEVEGDMESASYGYEQARLVESGMAALYHRFPLQTRELDASLWRPPVPPNGGENDANEGGDRERGADG